MPLNSAHSNAELFLLRGLFRFADKSLPWIELKEWSTNMQMFAEWDNHRKMMLENHPSTRQITTLGRKYTVISASFVVGLTSYIRLHFHMNLELCVDFLALPFVSCSFNTEYELCLCPSKPRNMAASQMRKFPWVLPLRNIRIHFSSRRLALKFTEVIAIVPRIHYDS